ncbi:chemotaxis protein MotB [Thermomonas haemolytica]|uniref:Chemotaxis protein MotB n=1 Tax=Thermomonas haemolytica TaxID=141949 RepID=A0A4R3NBC1_9GAMM|nr:chemotaxis protein MotB [Thermomonas haemolytica]TNY29023.1 flagellar motor protein MotB [Thermomonas haemolytica]
MARKDDKSTVIIRRVKKIQGGGHHGGSWKVAYADFVTAMMAFFLVMWLVGALTTKQREAISDYFKNPSPVAGESTVKAQGQNGPGGASTSMIKLGGTMELPKNDGKELTRAPRKDQPPADMDQRKLDQNRLEQLMKDLQEAIAKSQALEPFKDQLLLDITPEGLRIQIVDKLNRPMFDLGSAKLMPYTVGILHELGQFVNRVPNLITIAGHTDTANYASRIGYSNWELSADRANAARRALLEGGMQPDKVVRVIGFGSSVLFDKQNPLNPINRRISIVVMTQAAADEALGKTEVLPVPVAGPVPAMPSPGPVPAAPASATASGAAAQAATGAH